MIKLKIFWYKHKYDVMSIIIYFVFWYILQTMYNVQLYHWRFWMIMMCTIILRLMGYRQGKQDISQALTTNLNDLTLNAPNNNVTEAKIELQCLQNGMTFSLYYTILSHKFIKCETIDDKIKCWNIDNCEFVEFQKTTDVILYKTKTIYFPILTIKKKGKQ